MKPWTTRAILLSVLTTWLLSGADARSLLEDSEELGDDDYQASKRELDLSNTLEDSEKQEGALENKRTLDLSNTLEDSEEQEGALENTRALEAEDSGDSDAELDSDGLKGERELGPDSPEPRLQNPPAATSHLYQIHGASESNQESSQPAEGAVPRGLLISNDNTAPRENTRSGNAELSIPELPKARSWDDTLGPAHRGYKTVTHRKISLFFPLKTVSPLLGVLGHPPGMESAPVVALGVTEPDFSFAEEEHDVIMSRPHGKVAPSFKSSPCLP
ncbi:UNVERIFIED_CONTAM: hypothetical protein FKN15_073580 [Acipenser sinensis]